MSFRNKLLAGFVLTFMLVLAMTLVTYHNLSKLQQEHRAINHAQSVSKVATNLLQFITDAETAARGYFGTREEVFIQPFNEAMRRIDNELSRLRDSSENDPVQFPRVESLSSYVTKKKGIMESYVNLRRTTPTIPVLPKDKVLEGKIAMDVIRKITGEIIMHEQLVVDNQQKASVEAGNGTLKAIITGSAIFLIVVSMLFIYIHKTFRQKEDAEQKVEERNNSLERTLFENKHQNWLMAGLKHLAEEMQGQKNITDLCYIILKELLTYTDGTAGTLYLYDAKTRSLILTSSYAVESYNSIVKRVELNHTWIGQVASLQEPKMLSGKINPNLSLSTSIVNKRLAHCFIVPFFYEKQIVGVIELGYYQVITSEQEEFILSTMGRVGITVHLMLAKAEMESLYNEIQQQAEELTVQQEELREMNEELLMQVKKSS